MPIPSDPHIDLLTRDQVARLLNISRASVYRLVERRHIPFYKIGGRLRFDRNDVLAFLLKHRIEGYGTHTYGRPKT